MGMGKVNKASYTKTAKGWQVIVAFERHWDAPKVGAGLGTRHNVTLYKRGDYRGQEKVATLTSRVFVRDGIVKAFATVA